MLNKNCWIDSLRRLKTTYIFSNTVIYLQHYISIQNIEMYFKLFQLCSFFLLCWCWISFWHLTFFIQKFNEPLFLLILQIWKCWRIVCFSSASNFFYSPFSSELLIMRRCIKFKCSLRSWYGSVRDGLLPDRQGEWVLVW